jgi:hypothetical protein
MPVQIDEELVHAHNGVHAQNGHTARATGGRYLGAHVEEPLEEGRRDCFIPVLDPRDWDGVADGERRFSVASEIVELLRKHGGHVLLSKMGSLMSEGTREALRELGIRLLTFLQEKPHNKYFKIDGAGGAQVLVLRHPSASAEMQSIDALRAELHQIMLADEQPRMLRSVGSSLSHSARLTLKSNKLRLSKFLMMDQHFVVRENRVSLAKPRGVVQHLNGFATNPHYAGHNRVFDSGDELFLV